MTLQTFAPNRAIWHPCSQMKDYAAFPPLDIVSAKGSYFFLKDGRKMFDAISSWWCKSLGHGHPSLRAAILAQIEQFEHVTLAHATNSTIETLSFQLTQLTNTLKHVFYASDGSCAVEIALKMSLHAQQLRGASQRTQFIALANGYHGETIGALSVSDVGLYRTPYATLLFPVKFLTGLPYVYHQSELLWQNCASEWEIVLAQLEPYQHTAAAVIVEPIVQGAGGMKIYSPDLLKRLHAWCRANNVYLIVDEIMTGIGRTGKMLACEHANIEPDFLCLSKGLTAGWLPMSAVLTTADVYQLFYADYAAGKSFLHSHTFAGNPLAASVALAVLKIINEQELCAHAGLLGACMYDYMIEIAAETDKLSNVRSLGAIVAADLVTPHPRAGFAVYQKAVELGAFLRPLGNTIYWLPPLNTELALLKDLQTITRKAIFASGV